MFCTQCSKKIDPQAQFCANCGHPLSGDEKVKKPQAAKRSLFWLKMFSGCAAVVAVFVLVASLVTSEPSTTIEEQLTALRENHMTKAYYDYTSRSFQDAVSLEHFRQFIEQHPVFSESRSVRFIKHNIEVGGDTLEAVLTSHKGVELPVQYRLTKEGDKWKILSIKFEETDSSEPPIAYAESYYSSEQIAMLEEPKALKTASNGDVLDIKPFTEPVQAQLVQIRQHHIEKAYEEYTAKEFQKITTLKEFNTFIKGHAGFANNSSLELGKLTVDNNTVMLAGTLHAKSGAKYPVEYHLVFENDAWKILHIEVLDQEKRPQPAAVQKSSLQFEKFVIGTNINGNGIVSNPATTFKENAGELHLNLYIKHAKAGAQIDVFLEHSDSNTNAPVVKALAPDDGDLILSFAFSPPASGWPKGNYRILVTSSTDEQGSVDFKVE